MNTSSPTNNNPYYYQGAALMELYSGGRQQQQRQRQRNIIGGGEVRGPLHHQSAAASENVAMAHHHPSMVNNNNNKSNISDDEGVLRDAFPTRSTAARTAVNNKDTIATLRGGGPQQQQFQSALGQRIWQNYQLNRTNISITAPPPPPFRLSNHHHLPSTDFLRLPPKMVRIKRHGMSLHNNSDNNNCKINSSSSNNDGVTWVNMDELERHVLQSHLDYETTTSSLLIHDNSSNNNNNNSDTTITSSTLLTSECFSRILERHSHCGLGMSLREYNGCVYIQGLLRLDGSRMMIEDEEGEESLLLLDQKQQHRQHKQQQQQQQQRQDTMKQGGPAYKAGLRPGDRLLGLNGHPFLKGVKVPELSSSSSVGNSSSNIVQTHNNNNNNTIDDPEDVLRSVGDAISSSKSPLVIHIQRERDETVVRELLQKLQSSKSSRKVPTEEGTKSSSSSLLRPGAVAPPIQQHYDNNNNTSSPLEQQPQQQRSPVKPKSKGPYIHPFATALAQRNIIKSSSRDEQLITQQIRIFTDRARQWESKLSFRLRASDFALRPQLDARDVEPSYYASFLTDDDPYPPYFDYKLAKSVRSYAPSTPMIQDWRLSRGGGSGDGLSLSSPSSRRMNNNRRVSREAAVLADLYAGLDEDDAKVQDLILGETSKSGIIGSGGGGVASNHGGGNESSGIAYPSSEIQVARAMGDATDLYVPLVGVRKAVCVRILNSFLDNKNRTAFTIWCFDIESGMEWYAPARYFADFKELRTALMRIDKSIGDIPFPSFSWSLGFPGISSEANESESTKQARRQQLETFLRNLFASVYRGRLNPYLAEVAVHLQTFIGCDTVLTDGDTANLTLDNQVAINEITYGKRTPNATSEQDSNARMHLKRSIQRYVYRLFLLPSVEKLVSHFVDTARQKVTNESSHFGPSKRQSVQFNVNKDVATDDVEKIRDFIDQLQELILDGCHEDFISISQRRDFASLVDDVDNSIRDELFREAVREQVELEVYVPLRSTISKYLVYAWFNEDMEMKHKMKALENKPQSFFRIPKEHRSRSDWSSVSKILQEGVGRSTLPCVKLRAIVDAAKEITHLDGEERSHFPEATFFDGKVVTKTKTLGADDFLPIFIFCFVKAKIERPQALCALLQTMCDPAKMNGETGYYLSSFHAAMTHIHEDLDLSEVNDELAIFLESP
jgi:hypothetical protein